jgi:F-type H+-transporting ATPase subunit delta
MVLKAARRYANALLQLAIEQEILESVLNDVELIDNTIRGSKELKLFLRSPVIKPDDKKRVLEALFTERCTSLTVQFLDLVIRKRRERLLEQIMQGFIKLYKIHEGIEEVELHSAMELPANVIENLTQTLGKHTGKKIDLSVRVRPELKGGIAIKIGDTVIDGTVRHKIDQLQTLFRQTAA